MPSLLHAGVFQPQLLAHALGRDLSRPALHLADGRLLSVGEVRDSTSQYLQALADSGLRPGARVGILSKNRPEVIYAMNALMLGGYCVVPLPPMASQDDLAYMAGDAALEALIFDPVYFQEAARRLQAQWPGLALLLAMGATEIGADLCALARRYAPQAIVPPDVGADDICRISYSGGTTGRPKGILSTQRSALTMCTAMLSEWEWPQDLRHLVCSPMSHAGAAVLVPILMRDGALVVLPGFEPVAVMEAIQRHRITSTLMVPAMIYALLDHPRRREFDLSSLQTIFYGASSISPARLREAIGQFGPVFFQFYGQTEAPMTITVLRRGDHDPDDPLRLASCGRPVPWVRLALLDDAGQPVADGAPGEVCVRGPLVGAGYLNQPEQTREAFEGGWLHTGDVAVRDADGFLRIVDRKKDMIVSGGFNVFPREVEDALTAHSAVAAAAVVGIADAKWGEAVTAAVVLREGHTVDATVLAAWVRERKGPVHVPKTIHFMPSIPLSALGKVDRHALRAHFNTPP